MYERVGERAKLGMIAPMTNTVVEHDYHMMRPPGVTFHYGRAHLENIPIDSDKAFEDVIMSINVGTEKAMPSVLACKPQHIVWAQSIETFWDGAEGAERFVKWAEGLTEGLGVTTGAQATLAGLQRFEGIKRIATVSPYYPVGDRHVRSFFEDHGYEVVEAVGLEAPSATAMSEIPASTLRGVLKSFDRPEIDAVVGVGTNMSMVRVADEAERWLEKPVISINAACVWHALRAIGIDDQYEGFGSLLRSH